MSCMSNAYYELMRCGHAKIHQTNPYVISSRDFVLGRWTTKQKSQHRKNKDETNTHNKCCRKTKKLGRTHRPSGRCAAGATGYSFMSGQCPTRYLLPNVCQRTCAIVCHHVAPALDTSKWTSFGNRSNQASPTCSSFVAAGTENYHGVCTGHWRAWLHHNLAWVIFP